MWFRELQQLILIKHLEQSLAGSINSMESSDYVLIKSLVSSDLFHCGEVTWLLNLSNSLTCLTLTPKDFIDFNRWQLRIPKLGGTLKFTGC